MRKAFAQPEPARAHLIAPISRCPQADGALLGCHSEAIGCSFEARYDSFGVRLRNRLLSLGSLGDFRFWTRSKRVEWLLLWPIPDVDLIDENVPPRALVRNDDLCGTASVH